MLISLQKQKVLNDVCVRATAMPVLGTVAIVHDSSDLSASVNCFTAIQVTHALILKLEGKHGFVSCLGVQGPRAGRCRLWHLRPPLRCLGLCRHHSPPDHWAAALRRPFTDANGVSNVQEAPA